MNCELAFLHFRPQRRHRIQLGRFAGRIDAKEYAHRRGQEQSKKDRTYRHERGKYHNKSKKNAHKNAAQHTQRHGTLVRSVTLTSMMFMMTTPPTTSAMEARPSTTDANSELICFQMSRNVSLVSTSKSSGVPGASWRRVRISTRAWSLARSITSALPLARA